MPRKRPSTNQSSTTHCKSNPTPKPNPLPARVTPPYFVLDTILPSHIVNDRSLFTTYTASNHVYRTSFGNDIKIAGTGDVEICVQAGAGKTITFTVRDCWHIPSSSQNFLSCLTVTSPARRHQVMLAARTPRLLFPHKDRLATPNLPKYVPFTRERGFFVLKFKVPTKIPIPPEPAPADTKSSSQKLLSLYASSCQPFAGLTFTRHSFCPSPPHSLTTSSSTLPQSNFHVSSSNSSLDVPVSPISYSVPSNFQPQSLNSSHEHTNSPNIDTSQFPSLPQPTTAVPQTRSFSHPVISLHTSSSPPFAGLSDHEPFTGLTRPSSSSFPPTLPSCQRLPSDIAVPVDVHVHRCAHPTGYTNVDFASHGDGDAPVNMDGLIVLNQSGDVGVDFGSHGGVNVASTSASEPQQHPHCLPSSSMGGSTVDSSSLRRSLVLMNVSSSAPHRPHHHQRFTTLPPRTPLTTTVSPMHLSSFTISAPLPSQPASDLASLNLSSNLYITSQTKHGDNIPSFIPGPVVSPSQMRVPVCPTNLRTLTAHPVFITPRYQPHLLTCSRK